MSERSISIRLNSEAAKLYEEYRKKWNIVASDSQIFRAGLGFLMALPDAVSGNEIDELIKKQNQLIVEARKILEKHPDPQLYEIWIKLMENMDKIESCLEKSAEKYSNVAGDGKAGRKPDPNKKHTPGRFPKSELGYS